MKSSMPPDFQLIFILVGAIPAPWFRFFQSTGSVSGFSPPISDIVDDTFSYRNSCLKTSVNLT